MLLLCSLGLAQASKSDTSSTGKLTEATVNVPISYIKDANAKLIERDYLLKAIAIKDTIINLNGQYISEQNKVITDFQRKVLILNETNYKINRDLAKQKQQAGLFKVIAGSAILVTIVNLIIN